MKNSFLFLFILVAFTACESRSNCDDVLCESPIPFVALNIVDALTGENVFSNETYSLEDVELINQNNESLAVRLDAQNYLESAIGDIPGSNHYRLLISPGLEIQLVTEVAAANEECCSSPNLVSFDVLNYEFEQNDVRSYTIFID